MTELGKRIVSAVVLAPLALAALWYGGWASGVMFAACAGLMMMEWRAITAPDADRRVTLGLIVVMSGAVLVGLAARLDLALLLVLVIALVAGLEGRARLPRGSLLGAVGVIYCGLPPLAAVGLRSGMYGLEAIALVFAVVWATDIVAFFTGRAIGGPKLWERVSPKKTWSGALGGLLGAILAAAIVAHLAGGGMMLMTAIAVPLSMASQAGDLFESALKRRFGVKDSGRLIPGHGGILDRVDGLVFALVTAYILGYFRNAADVAAGLVGR